MPHYDYVCADCGYQEEILQKMMEATLTHCPQCLQPSFKRKIGAGIGLQFQGSGFYITDYARQVAPGSGQEKTASSSKGCGCNKPTCSST